MHFYTTGLLAFIGLASQVHGHGYLTGYKVGGKWIDGWKTQDYYQSTPVKVPGWSTLALDNGFVSPNSYQDPDIICHKSAAPGKTSVTIAAGQTIQVFWNTWPSDSHRGPVLDYLAQCLNNDCTTVDKTTLKFAKIDAVGLKSGPAPGTWATDDLHAANNSWTITIPSKLKAGSYVLRHEIIALHGAGSDNGAQNYPQCVNLIVTGGGSTAISGESAEAFYKRTDPGIKVDIYNNLNSYTIPGPAVQKF